MRQHGNTQNYSQPKPWNIGSAKHLTWPIALISLCTQSTFKITLSTVHTSCVHINFAEWSILLFSNPNCFMSSFWHKDSCSAQVLHGHVMSLALVIWIGKITTWKMCMLQCVYPGCNCSLVMLKRLILLLQRQHSTCMERSKLCSTCSTDTSIAYY
jgi:hypothetical protein